MGRKNTSATQQSDLHSRGPILRDNCKSTIKQHWNILWEAKTYFERLQETGISQLHSIGPFSAFCIPEIAPEGFPVIILYLWHIIKIIQT